MLRWEHDYQQHGYLPHVDSDNATDAGYLYARIQEALALAAEYGASEGDRLAELNALKVRIEELGRELRFHSADARAFLETLRGVVPDLQWVCGGTFCVFADDEDAALAAATRLRLPEMAPYRSGRVWRGEIEGWPVSVYGPA
ncbi:hypothetical protein [Nocardia australiensis]|uniref:hypothetical protein n=1 Tax=Nocardia australiensis TaxID=2887191 RepID=UPI001D145FC5|nr:hypothetical protein [Nocardia australiensis]